MNTPDLAPVYLYDVLREVEWLVAELVMNNKCPDWVPFGTHSDPTLACHRVDIEFGPVGEGGMPLAEKHI